MSTIATSRSSTPAAQRMRRDRKHRRKGLRSLRILLGETDIDALICMEHLTEDQRQDPKASRRRSYASSTRPKRTSRDCVTLATRMILKMA
jgi:hypothetical protein